MKSVFQKILIALLAILWGVSSVQAQSVNMSRYITLTVKSGENIELDFSGDADGTQVKIVSGAQEQTVTVGTSWLGPQRYTAGAETMTVYGNVSKFNCNSNVAKITGLDASHNSELKSLLCYKNKLSSLDISKCGKLTELDCGINSLTSLNLSSCGELIELDCSSNSLTSLDVAHNTKLTDLSCYDNKLTSIDISKNTQLILFSCSGNSIASLDVKNNTKLEEFFCHSNSLTSLDVSSNTRLVRLNCSNNKIESLDLSNNMKLQFLFCFANSLTSLKFNPDSKLNSLYCYDNKFTTAALDDIYCSLPDRKGVTAGVMQPLLNASSPDKDIVLATNGSRLTAVDISYNTALSVLWCSNNRITSLNTGNNTTLAELYCEKNNLKNLDISRNTGLKVLDCSDNSLTSLDLSNNKSLEELLCYKNAFTTSALDNLYCTLPDYKMGADAGNIFPLYNSEDTGSVAVLASNGNNATAKNWAIQYYDESTDITGFTGTHQCGNAVDMSRYITLTVKEGEKIHLNIWAEAADTPIKVVSGDKEQTVTVGTAWTGYRNYTAGAGSMTVYGKVLKFDCNENMENITGLDVSHNTQLAFLDCGSNSLTALDVSNNKELVNLGCGSNSLSSLDVKNNTKLEWFDCKDNSLTSLDVSHNTQLKWLGCNDNSISMLDIKNNTMLRILYCYNNSLTSLDVANNKQLQGLYCQDNNFTTEALDDIFCSLPDRKGIDNGIAQLLFDASSSDKSKVLAANGSNATSRNWKVQYFGDDAEITGFTGTHQCGGGTGIDEMKGLPSLAVYPNPVKDVLNIATDKPVHSIRIYNVYGTEVAQAANTKSINVSHLPAGVYMVSADSKVIRIIKE